MNTTQRIELIYLLGEELHETVRRYQTACEGDCRVVAGCTVDMFDCREALKRRIMVLREELLELSKSL